jgi:hypothetical protein
VFDGAKHCKWRKLTTLDVGERVWRISDRYEFAD